MIFEERMLSQCGSETGRVNGKGRRHWRDLKVGEERWERRCSAYVTCAFENSTYVSVSFSLCLWI